ncbi:VC2046/SO_2500 family protein [Vibrio sinaloensis]|uniref:Queuosine biosynthesis protein QueD n=1 Tax=Photobacterium sp. (strain ATCC 43367) TaxID=379097 RepID=A0A0A5HRG0_PHOS4|nr:VC2046/SO_2500 family protein [Vibrio sinaloensis]KGY08142.1 queuosine biosynthesis protein QueD [Vibrio sinaloensis]
MQIHTLDKASIINELQFGTSINHAVHEGRRADFALILSMFSDDVRDNTPVEKIEQPELTENVLRQRFELPEPQPLRSDQSSYDISATQASLFHSAGLPSAKLSHYLKPDALTYLPEDTHNLPEEVYHNLSGHQRRQLGEKEPKQLMPADLYNKLISAQRSFQISAQA